MTDVVLGEAVEVSETPFPAIRNIRVVPDEAVWEDIFNLRTISVYVHKEMALAMWPTVSGPLLRSHSTLTEPE